MLMSSQYDSVGSSLSQYLWFGVGAIAVTLLAVVLSVTGTVDGSHGTTRHRRAFHNTVPQNDTVSMELQGTVLNDTVSNDSSDAQLSNVHQNLTLNVSTANLSTATTSRPHKPHYADAVHLKQDISSADGSKYRDKIRQHLGKVPEDASNELNSDTNKNIIPSTPATSTTTIVLTNNSNSNISSNTNNGTVSDAKPNNVTVSENITLWDIMRDIMHSAMTSNKQLDSKSPLTTTISTPAFASAAGVATNTSSVNNLPTTTSISWPVSQSVAMPHATATAVSQSVATFPRNSLSTMLAGNLASSTTITHNSHYHTSHKPQYVNASSQPKHNLSVADGTKHRDKIGDKVSKIPEERDNKIITSLLSTPFTLQHGSTTLSLAVNALSTLTFLRTTPNVTTATEFRPHKPYYANDAHFNSSTFLHSSNKSVPCQVILLTIALITLLVAVISGFGTGSSACFYRYSFATESHHSGSQTHGWCMLATVLLLHFFLSAIQWTYSCLIVEYASSFLSWHSTTSVILLLVYWACYSVGRIISCVIMFRMRPWLLIFTGVILSSVSSLAMLLAGLLQRTDTHTDVPVSNVLVWFSSGLLGFSTSVILPASEHYIPSSKSLSVVIPVGASLGQATVPPIAALLADIYSPSHIMKALCITAFGLVFAAILLKYIVARSSIADTSRKFHFVDDHSSVEEYDAMMVDEEQELLSPNDVETSLINHPVSSSPLRTRSRTS